ncbi:MAG: hypothetical protein SWY16_25925 [Cyanobacteriota bacterium]|nr:hypothetical protein [Cyanobacteriota bacterium]
MSYPSIKTCQDVRPVEVRDVSHQPSAVSRQQIAIAQFVALVRSSSILALEPDLRHSTSSNPSGKIGCIPGAIEHLVQTTCDEVRPKSSREANRAGDELKLSLFGPLVNVMCRVMCRTLPV